MQQSPKQIGYGAVVIPHLDEYQGFFLVDDPALHRPAVQMQMLALATAPTSVIGSLQAAVAEGVITRNMVLVGTAALALYGITKKPFFWIKASRESGGTRTEMFSLQAETADAARVEVNNLPLVKAMRERLVTDVRKHKH